MFKDKIKKYLIFFYLWEITHLLENLYKIFSELTKFNTLIQASFLYWSLFLTFSLCFPVTVKSDNDKEGNKISFSIALDKSLLSINRKREIAKRLGEKGRGKNISAPS